jgi:hypothetical protein
LVNPLGRIPLQATVSSLVPLSLDHSGLVEGLCRTCVEIGVLRTFDKSSLPKVTKSALANQTRYGLAAGIWTNDIKRAHRVARDLQAGTVWINTYRAISYASPFGGYKQSGYGREMGLEAIREFTQVKSVWVDLAETVPDPFMLR